MKSIDALTISIYLGSDLIGNNIEVYTPSPLDNCLDNSVCFINKATYRENIELEALFIVMDDKDIDPNSKASYIKVKNPRLAYAKAVAKFFNRLQSCSIAKSATIHSSAQVGENVSIGEYSIIGRNVTIGDNTVINSNVVLADDTVVGSGCYLKSGSVIGEDGFGFDFEEDGTPIRIPHLGGVVIKDNVEIGAKCTVARGTLSDTVIESFVKIDDQVHIAHNCVIGEKTIITACAELSGSVKVGERCWIGPNVSIMQKVNIGDEALVGIGAVVTKDIKSKKKFMGLESFELKELLKIKKTIGLR